MLRTQVPDGHCKSWLFEVVAEEGDRRRCLDVSWNVHACSVEVVQ
jgi:hypothetical protein